jgi:hypothetical protein
MRRTITLAMIVGGIALMLLGYLGSAPWGANSVTNSDPRFGFAPAIFVLGVIVAFSSALVYELMPNRHDR